MNGEMSKKLTVPSRLTSPNLTVLVVSGKYSGDAAMGDRKGVGEEPSALTMPTDNVPGFGLNSKNVPIPGTYSVPCLPTLKASWVPSGDQLNPLGS